MLTERGFIMREWKMFFLLWIGVFFIFDCNLWASGTAPQRDSGSGVKKTAPAVTEEQQEEETDTALGILPGKPGMPTEAEKKAKELTAGQEAEQVITEAQLQEVKRQKEQIRNSVIEDRQSGNF